MSERKTVIKLDNVSKRFNVYGRNIDRIKGVLFDREPLEVKHALRNITLEIKEGERVVVMGVVDSGRSTLAKVIAGITLPSRGEVDTFGKCMNVMLDSKAGLEMEFSCKDNIYMKANIVGLTKEEIKPHVDKILEFAEIVDFADLPLKRAPKGTAALISTAVHLYKDSEIVICDEVFGGGGNYVSLKCEERMREFLADKPRTTLIMITNRGISAKKIGTRFLVMDEGSVVCDSSADEALKTLTDISKNRGKKR